MDTHYTCKSCGKASKEAEKCCGAMMGACEPCSAPEEHGKMLAAEGGEMPAA